MIGNSNLSYLKDLEREVGLRFCVHFTPPFSLLSIEYQWKPVSVAIVNIIINHLFIYFIFLFNVIIWFIFQIFQYLFGIGTSNHSIIDKSS